MYRSILPLSLACALAACAQAQSQLSNAGSETAAKPMATTTTADDAAQAQRGKRLFIRCAACHETGEPQVAKVGPHLKGIVGRPAGSVSGYAYSKGLGAGGFTWTEDKLSAWLERPTALVPDTTMVMEGMAVEADRRALVAYLRTLR